jgi:hypothetical protein
LYLGVFVTGVFGNMIVCVVIVKNASMHTATNYYLFSLAVSDLIFLMMGESCLFLNNLQEITEIAAAIIKNNAVM